ncbi:MAG: tetratricopeptide repeat protein [Treponema sp.]|nr:tetratricopeptide repeat protein [Treponema sp.]
MIKKTFYLFFIISLFLIIIFSGCAGGPVSAQEYYSIGMAYFELGKYEEAEKWLSRARLSDRTLVASTYNLGRLAFERERYEEAAKYFESILKKDPDNVLALKAAAYSRIKTTEIEIAEKHYYRLLDIVPESADDGYNHALVLYTLERYSAAEEVLLKYPVALQENKDTMLLFARCQAALKKLEAIDRFADWLSVNSDAKVRYEYAQTLEYHELYARALEEYRLAHTGIADTSVNPKKSDVRFAIAKVLLTADGENAEGAAELEKAVLEGFDNIPSVEGLLAIKGVSTSNKNSIQNTINAMRMSAAEKEKQEQERLAAETVSESVENEQN